MSFMLYAANLDLTSSSILLLYKFILKLETGAHLGAGLKKVIFHLTDCKHWLEADKQFRGFADSL